MFILSSFTFVKPSYGNEFGMQRLACNPSKLCPSGYTCKPTIPGRTEGFCVLKGAIACGAGERCADGYYCSGAIGSAKSGVCVANGVQIILCRALAYMKLKIIRILLLFGAVFAGIYFLMGKFSYMTFAQILVGMGIIYGASNIIERVTGSAGICGFDKALSCAQTATTGTKTLKDQTKIFNLEQQNRTPNYTSKAGGNLPIQCDPLTCVRAKCLDYNIDVVETNGIKKNVCTLRGGRKVDAIVANANASGTPFEVKNCQANFNVICDAVQGSYKRDYFKCQSCAGETFYAEAPSSAAVEDCKALVTKQMKETQ